MCGRYASARSVEDLASTFGISAAPADTVPAPDWNVAPTKHVAAILKDDGRRRLTTLRWGLVAGRGAGGAGRRRMLFNARVETITEKPTFRDAVRSRRCLLPADGWYEWARLPDGRKVPHFLSAADGSVLALAGVWVEDADPEGRPCRATAIVTTDAPADLRHVHDRSPVVLGAESWARWLDEAVGAEEAVAIARTSRVAIRLWPVSDRIGDVRSTGTDLAAPVAVDAQPPLF